MIFHVKKSLINWGKTVLYLWFFEWVLRPDGKVIRQKPAVPPKPNIPKPGVSEGAMAVGSGGSPAVPPLVVTPKRVQASMKTLAKRGKGVSTLDVVGCLVWRNNSIA